MSTTTRDIVAHADIAEGLRVIAQMFDQGDMPAKSFPEQALTVQYTVGSEARLRELAARVGVDVEENDPYVYFHYPIGKGTGEDFITSPAYRGAVVLSVWAEVSR
jgi:hypothetical protein